MYSKQRIKGSIGTTATELYTVANTSGIDLGNIHICNTTPNDRRLFFCLTTGDTMSTGSAVVWDAIIGGSGLVSISQPMFMANGDKIVASGSAAGLVTHISFLKLN